jgi:catechol 2,3-dioxygenase-like lactoylglutathione lyase family enzyme
VKPQLSFVTLGVADLNRATRFYAEWLGLVPLESPPGASFFDLGQIRLALYGRDRLATDADVAGGGTGFSGFALSLNVGSAEQVDRLLRQASGAGGRITRPAGPTSWGGYMGYLADPDSFLWEVVWNPRFSVDRSRTPGSGVK